MRLGALVGLALLAAACATGRARVVAPAAAPRAIAPPATASVEEFPGGPGLDILREDCLACHSADLLRQQRLTQAQWAKTIDKMHGWGAWTEGEELATLTAYLAGAYGREAPPYVPQLLRGDAAAALTEPLPDPPFAGGDRGRGSALYAERCAPCHGDDGRGGELGVAVAGRHVLDRAADFAAVVRAGRARMPEFTEATDPQIADLLAHVRSLFPAPQRAPAAGGGEVPRP